ncbi:hypothetical protein PHLGIDRAFT_35334 [Phlebiopsis gigantea 11061_1 CR5-6]|uniref:Uncharacterized protein n=1 Tax=Phlebiopsis gigantea (strain 11061_1 CR5-6) TaxID=745531 RepID=A0A0C3RZ82_PHLG1|nr:hypothetical protein PHLGIDRAFT_35334 [Phlebiopsis gigantea 11061_1 CR5-6]
MFTTVLSAAAILSALAIRGVKADDFSIATPQFTQCQDVHVTWEGGKAPYNLLIVPNDDPCEKTLVDLGDHQGQSITWNVGLPAGTQLLLSLADATDEEAWSHTITVGASNDTSCLAGASSSSSVASSSVASSSVSSSSVSVASSTSFGILATLTIPADLSSPSTTSSAASSSTQSAAVAVGAANAGLNPNSSGAASTISKLSGSAVALAAVVAVFASL